MAEIRSAATIVPVRDVARSAAFYCDVLGFNADFMAQDGSVALLSQGPAALQLLATDDERALRATASNIAIYITVSGLEEMYVQLKPQLDLLPAGRVRPPFDQPYGMREFHVKDPDGCLLFFGEDSTPG